MEGIKRMQPGILLNRSTIKHARKADKDDMGIIFLPFVRKEDEGYVT
jgi:hypothetical protein